MAEAYDPARAERNRAILDDRIRGMSFRKLAAKHGLSLAAVHGIVKDYTESTIKPAAEELVQIEIDRLEGMLEALMPRIELGEPRAIEVGIKLSESLRKLTGVDAAIKMTVEHTVSDQEDRIAQMIRKASQIHADKSE